MVLSAIYSLLFYFATLVLVLGIVAKVISYLRVPSPLVIPTTPAPLTTSGVAARMFREVVLFESLFRGNKWIWLFGYLFHFGMLAVLLRHLRYFTDPVWSWVAMMQWIGIYAGFAMALGLTGLLLRRFFVERVRYISAYSDYLILLLLILITLSGLMMTFVNHTDIIQVKGFIRGMMTMDWHPLPADPPILIHLMLVILLMIIFPFSKLLHAPGIFFSPTRNMKDTPREHRHLASWAKEMENRTQN